MAGRAYVAGNDDDFLVMKLANDDGRILWMRTLDGAENMEDRAWAIAVGSDDHVTVTGVSANADGSADFLTASLDGDSGAVRWRRSFPGAVNNLYERAGWLSICDDGDIVMANRTWTITSSYDVVLHRYAAASGDTLWTRLYNSGGAAADDPRDMRRDAAGNLLVAGVRAGNFMVLKFDAADGGLAWSAEYDGPTQGYDAAAALIEGPGGEVIVTGFSTGAGTSWDVTTVGFGAQDGTRLWVRRYDVSFGADEGRTLAVTPLGDLYVVGYGYGFDTDSDILCLRYDLEILVSVEEDSEGGPGTTLPDPTRRGGEKPAVTARSVATKVQFDVRTPAAGPVRLAVHDVHGREVAVVWDGVLAAGPHILEWRPPGGVPSGVYFARLEQGRTTAVAKVIRVR